jgi:hypothetical protein
MAKTKMLTNALVKSTGKDSALGKAARGYQKWSDGTIVKDAMKSVFGGNTKKTNKTKTKPQTKGNK